MMSLNAAWSLEIFEHARARLLQRAPDADLRAAAFEAALAFAAADAKTVEPLISTATSIFLPAGPGCFVGTVISSQTASEREIYLCEVPHLPVRRQAEAQSDPVAPCDDREGTVAIQSA
jgi:hypothetical protein